MIRVYNVCHPTGTFKTQQGQPNRLGKLLLCKKKKKKKKKKGKRKVQGVPQSQTAALPRHQKEEETDRTQHAQIDQTYEKH